MKIFHSADIHYCAEHMEEVDRTFGSAVGGAIAAQCDVAVLAGDLFDHRVELHEECVYRALAQVQKLANAMPVLILQGTFSHDHPGSLDVFKRLMTEYPVHVADTIQQVAFSRSVTATWWDASKGPVMSAGWMEADPVALFSCMPPVHKGALAAALGAENVATGAGEAAYNMMRGFSVANEAARAAGIPTVLVTHGTVANCVTEHGVPMAGPDWELTTGTVFAAEASAAMLGHIHAHQGWGKDGRMAAYSGSCGRLHFGELDAKGYLVWDVQANGASYEFHPTPAKRLLQIECDGLPDIEQIKAQVAACGGAHVRIRWEIPEDQRHEVDRKAMEEMCLRAGAALCKIEQRVIPVTRQRAAGITATHSLDDKLRQWGIVTDTDAEPLVARLAQLQTADDTDSLVASIMDGLEGVGATDESEEAA